MEERVPPAGVGNHDHDPLQETQPTFRSGTYVVQVPKDQVYRIPTPEHALIAERHRNPGGRSKRSCCSCFLCLFILVIIIVIIVGVIAGFSLIFFKPKYPKFCVEHVLVKKPHSNKHPHLVDYDIKLKVKNPNEKTGILYNEGGDASLSFRQQEIAVGKYPTFYQGNENSTVFNIVLNWSNSTVLPREIERSMKSDSSKVHISLSLSINNVPVRLKIGVVNNGSTKIAVTCNLMLDTLAKDTRILSQECHTKGLL